MKVAKYYNNKDVRIEELKKPKINKGEILVKMLASGICGTDIMEWYRIKKGPRILGHEIVGEIVESKSDKYSLGQRVFVSHHVPCNKCKYCSNGHHTACETLHKGNYDPGGYSEFIRIPEINVQYGVYVLPDEVSDIEGTMIEPFACVVRGQRVIDVREGQTVLILGSGVSGLMNIEYAKALGAKVIATDIDEYRLKKSKEYGADEAVDAREELKVKADKIIMCTGAPSAISQAFECIDKKGTILLFAIPSTNIELPTVDIWRNEITVTSSYGAAPIDLEESLSLIKSKKFNIKNLITHTYPLKDIQKGFDTVVNAKNSLKVVMTP